MPRRPRPAVRAAAALVAAATAACLTACGGGSAGRGASTSAAPASCRWPSTSDPVGAGDVLAVDAPGGLGAAADVLVYDGRSGAVVGRCQVHGIVSATPPAAEPSQPGLTTFVTPPVGGSSVTQLPDNSSDGTHGGVRTVPGGRHADLAFTGWAVAATVGPRLLLERVDADATLPRTDPADWCVLPSAGAPRSACAGVPGASGAGSATVGADGAVVWVPTAGVPATVGTAAGRLLADGRTTVTGFRADSNGLLVPATVDERALLLPAGLGGTTSTVQWATVAFAGGTATTTLHDSGQRAATDPPSAAQVSADGHGLVLVGGPGDGCRARWLTDGGVAARDLPVALTTPNASRCARLVRYPTVTGTT